MKIIIDGAVYSFAPSGGVFRYFNEVIPRLSQFPDTEINIFTPKAGVNIPQGQNIKIESDKLPSGQWLPEGALKNLLRKGKRTLQSHLQKRFAGLERSIFHSTYYTPSPWTKLPQVVTVYDMISEVSEELYHLPHIKAVREAKAVCLKSSTRVIAISEKTKNDLKNIYQIPDSQIDVIYLGVDFNFFSEKKSKRDQEQLIQKKGLNRPYFLFLGGRLHHKNFPRLLRAFASSPISKDYDLAVAGAPWNETELDLLNTLGVNSKVKWIPQLQDSELPTLYQKAEAFVFPSLYEGFGLPLIEAMAAGCPVIASYAGPFPELSQGAALLFDPLDEGKIATSLAQVLSPTNKLELVENGKKQALKFSWDKSASQHIRTYQKALDSQR
jgi:glycosyltransferase involved in cell wall biosynthesis